MPARYRGRSAFKRLNIHRQLHENRVVNLGLPWRNATADDAGDFFAAFDGSFTVSVQVKQQHNALSGICGVVVSADRLATSTRYASRLSGMQLWNKFYITVSSATA